MTALKHSDALCRVPRPLDWTDAQRALMVAACRELAAFHQEHSPEMRHLYARTGFSPDQIQTEVDLARIPFVGVTAMKHFLLTSRLHEHAVLKLTSSGTRGQKTQIWFDQESLDRVQSTLDTLWEQEGLVSKDPANYLMFVYDPRQAENLGIAFSVANEQRFAPAKDTFYAIKKDASGAWGFRLEETIAAAERFAAEGIPVRIAGIPSFVFEFAKALESRPIPLPPGSKMMTGGGWKAAEDKRISKEEFRALVTRALGIPDERLRDGYGMAEHSAPYLECRAHRFHVPVYCRVIARDPVTLMALPPGAPGLLELLCPYNTMMPNLAILSTDNGMIDPVPCPCGWKAPTFSLLGRAGRTKHRGCAITASEIVQRAAR